jgi:initiation factor 1A
MPNRNVRGGKAYKKGKKPVDQTPEERAGKFFAKENDWQDYGRVLRMLGDRRVLCFCNDGNERIAKIRGTLCKGAKRKKIEVGDIVLLSFRDFEENNSNFGGAGSTTDSAPTATALMHSTGRKEIADLVEKYAREHWHLIRHTPDIHPHLFVTSTASNNGPPLPGDADDIFDGGRPDVIQVEKGADSSSEDESDDDKEIDVDAI